MLGIKKCPTIIYRHRNTAILYTAVLREGEIINIVDNFSRNRPGDNRKKDKFSQCRR